MTSDIENDLDDEFEWVNSDVIDDIDDELSHEKVLLSEEKTTDSDHKNTDSESERARDIKLYQFIASLSQIEHNFYSKDFNPHDLPFLSEKISSNVSIAKKIADAFDYKVNNLTHLYYFNILLKQVSYLSSAATHLGTRIEETLDDDEYIHKIKEVNIDGAVILEGELATNEVSMHIKSVLIPYCIYFENAISHSFTNLDLSFYLETSIEITKTLATKWNRGLNINKRHLLFVSALDTVARFVLHSLSKNIAKAVQEKMANEDISKSTIWDRIEQYHLGLEDHPSEKDILIEKIDNVINAEINDFYINNRTLSVLVSKDRARLYLIEKLGNTWLDFHDKTITKLQLMSEEEFSKHISKNKNKPDLSDFYTAASEDSKKLLSEVQSVAFDKNDLNKSIKQEFSTLWGVSDAYCKTIN